MAERAAAPQRDQSASPADPQTELLRGILAEIRAQRNDAALRENEAKHRRLRTLHDIYLLSRRDVCIWLDHYGLIKLGDEKEDRRTLFHFLTTGPGLEARKGRFWSSGEDADAVAAATAAVESQKI